MERLMVLLMENQRSKDIQITPPEAGEFIRERNVPNIAGLPIGLSESACSRS